MMKCRKKAKKYYEEREIEMSYYITHEEFQNHMKSYYERTGNKMQFQEMCKYIFQKGYAHSTVSFPKLDDDYES